MILGGGLDVNPAQLMLRGLLFVALVVPILGWMREPETCDPYCAPTIAEVAAAQSALPAPIAGRSIVPDRLPTGAKPITVAVYGDSRADFLAEGARLVPGWLVDNFGIPACPWMYGSPYQPNSHGKPCGGTELYVRQSGHHDVAIVYAGTVLPEVALLFNLSFEAIVANVQASLELIDADEVIVLATPAWVSETDKSDPARLERVDSAFVQAIALLEGAETRFVFAAGFDEWVESQPDECLPDGSHFTVDCALAAALWIRDQL